MTADQFRLFVEESEQAVETVALKYGIGAIDWDDRLFFMLQEHVVIEDA